MYKKHQNQQESNPSHHTPGSLTAMSASVGEDAPTEETIPGRIKFLDVDWDVENFITRKDFWKSHEI